MQAKLTNILQVPLSCRPGSSATGTSPHTSNVGSDLPRQLVLPLRAVSRRFSPILKMEHRKIGFYQNPLTIPSSEKQIPQSKNTMNELFNIQFLYKKESRSWKKLELEIIISLKRQIQFPYLKLTDELKQKQKIIYIWGTNLVLAEVLTAQWEEAGRQELVWTETEQLDLPTNEAFHGHGTTLTLQDISTLSPEKRNY